MDLRIKISLYKKLNDRLFKEHLMLTKDQGCDPEDVLAKKL